MFAVFLYIICDTAGRSARGSLVQITWYKINFTTVYPQTHALVMEFLGNNPNPTTSEPPFILFALPLNLALYFIQIHPQTAEI